MQLKLDIASPPPPYLLAAAQAQVQPAVLAALLDSTEEGGVTLPDREVGPANLQDGVG